MLLPFEGLGVETQWTLELPRGNNRFDFETIADVMLTIDYTAEYSRKYEQDQRYARSTVEVYEDTPVPLRLQFPDLWYHLKNHRSDAAGNFAPFAFTFRLPRILFAQTLKDPIDVAHLTMLLSGTMAAAEQQLLADGLTLRHRPDAAANATDLHAGKVPRQAPPAAGDPTSAFGIPVFGAESILLSTRGSSAGGLPTHPQIGVAAPDEWTIMFAPALFPAVIDKITDALLVITVHGGRA
jgi:hypothetical protein